MEITLASRTGAFGRRPGSIKRLLDCACEWSFPGPGLGADRRRRPSASLRIRPPDSLLEYVKTRDFAMRKRSLPPRSNGDNEPADPAPCGGEDVGTAPVEVPVSLTAREIGGPKGPEPTRYGDWEHRGRCTDF